MKLNKSLLITTALSIGITTPSYSKTDTSKLIEPIFESITATFQDDSFEKGQLSKAIISAKISNVINEKNAESFKGTIFEIVDDGGNKVILRDDGKGVDKRAKDGIFNALGMLDPHFILSRKERFAQLENSKTKPVIMAGIV